MVSRKSLRKVRKGRKSKKGGYPAPDPSSYSSAASYGQVVNGTQNSQFNRVFSNSSPDAQYPSNVSVGAQGQNLGYAPYSTLQTAGKRRKKRGGFWGSIINQAIVPFGLLGLQQSYRKKKHGGAKSRKHRKH